VNVAASARRESLKAGLLLPRSAAPKIGARRDRAGEFICNDPNFPPFQVRDAQQLWDASWPGNSDELFDIGRVFLAIVPKKVIAPLEDLAANGCNGCEGMLTIASRLLTIGISDKPDFAARSRGVLDDEWRLVRLDRSQFASLADVGRGVGLEEESFLKCVDSLVGQLMESGRQGDFGADGSSLVVSWRWLRRA
jgi:hypothetical protein